MQVARAAYQPKLPKSLKGTVHIKEGAPTQSVANQEEIAALFPNTYGRFTQEAGAVKYIDPRKE